MRAVYGYANAIYSKHMIKRINAHSKGALPS